MYKYLFLCLLISTSTQFVMAENDPFESPSDKEIAKWNTTLANSTSVKADEIWYQISLRDRPGTISQESERPKDKKGYITLSETALSLYDQYSKEIWKSKYASIQNNSKEMDRQVTNTLDISLDRLNAIRRWNGFVRNNLTLVSH